jgi:hypothetical protein
MKQPITRRQMIDECIKSYIRNNPTEWELFKNQVAERRKNLFDKDFGQLKKGNKIDEDSIRLAFSIPSKLHGAIATLLAADGGKSFLEEKAERKWFATNYPNFLIPNKY